MEELVGLISKAGWVLAPIALCSLVSLAAALERFFTLRMARVAPPLLMDQIKRELSRARISEALELCQKSWHPMSRVLEAGILKHRESRAAIQEAMENAGRQQGEVLERNLDLLALMANMAPLLGLFGTVLGLIRVFGVLHDIKDVGDPSVLAGGVAEALFNTAAGLSVAIPAMAFHHYFQKRAARLMLRMERLGQETLEILVKIQDPERDYRASLGELGEL